ncbi:SDR family NAD(P)-dependent oxidoreductase [Butyrivibrio sp. MC2013]|uniref:SDR family NAD(P)-dependent oxidoreductase n=1 Tax=Butyrivibrio sp. MC2013 TaxID=1280686 RepID=UPI00041C8A25|nr:SDR family NAD(P)-dependent oxidoreductase [Butyrivibrio sp. MC2013]
MNILVTGADRGLGYGMTRILLEMGHHVWAGRYMPEWTELDELKEKHGKKLEIIPLDVSDTESVKRAGDIILRDISYINAGSDDETEAGIGIKESGCLDMIISNAGINGKLSGEVPMESDYDYMMRTYNINSLGAVRLVEIFYQMMKGSDVRRLCFVSSEAGSITQAWRNDNFSYCMSKAALNMYVKLIYNRLHPEGYSFRLYHPGWIRSYMGGKLAEKGNLSIDEAADIAIRYFMDDHVDESELVMYGYDGERFQF